MNRRQHQEELHGKDTGSSRENELVVFQHDDDDDDGDATTSTTPNNRNDISVDSTATSTPSSSASTSSTCSLNPNTTVEQDDAVGIALLRQIFPDESTESLRALHYQRIHGMPFQTSKATKRSPQHEITAMPEQQQQKLFDDDIPDDENDSYDEDDSERLPISPLGRRLYRQWQQEQQRVGNDNEQDPKNNHWAPTELPESFLRLPTSVAVRRDHHHRYEYEFVDDLEQRAIQERYLLLGEEKKHNNNNRQQQQLSNPISSNSNSSNEEFFSVVIEKHPQIGLGLSLKELPTHHQLQVVGFKPHPENPCCQQQQQQQDEHHPNDNNAKNIQINDILFGINGNAFLFLPQPSLMTQTKQLIMASPNPIVLHLIRKHGVERGTSLLDTTNLEDAMPFDHSPPRPNQGRRRAIIKIKRKNNNIPSMTTTTPPVHPFAQVLVQKGLIRPKKDDYLITERLQQFTERAREWESQSSLHVHTQSHTLVPTFDPRDLPIDMASALIAVDTYNNNKNYAHAKSKKKKNNSNNNNSPYGTSFDGSSSSDDDDDDDEDFMYDDNTHSPPSTPPLTHDSPLIPPEYIDAFYGANNDPFEGQRYAQPTSLDHGWSSSSYPGLKQQHQQQSIEDQKKNAIFIPLYGVRKALSTRIVNTFVEETRVAYTIWVYDVESGKEWYAPIRYMEDFCDLRNAALALAPPDSDIAEWEFPNKASKKSSTGRLSSWVFSSPSRKNAKKKQSDNPADEDEEARLLKCRQLEHFLRSLCGFIYTCQPIHPDIAEIAIHVQSFLGVDRGLEEKEIVRIGDDNHDDDMFFLETPIPGHDHQQWLVRCQLKKCIQRYTWRLFLLNTMRAIVDDFVDTARANAPKLQDIESLQVRSTLKQRAMGDLERIQNFLDQLVDLILQGCGLELKQLSQRRAFSKLFSFLKHNNTKTNNNSDLNFYWDHLVREAVREQVEIEVYVPLRSVVSRLLVNGWRHEDMEVQFKIRELQKRPQSMFRIPEDKISPSDWQSVSMILKRGVGMSTLPCAKLRAIVDAAREISLLFRQEHGEDLKGADDFLPIFIFSVVRADMERPCALCVLLQTLCDRINRIGEIGYFLASFEAAISHIQGLDLAEDREEMQSFLTVPLTEVSLND